MGAESGRDFCHRYSRKRKGSPHLRCVLRVTFDGRRLGMFVCIQNEGRGLVLLAFRL